LSSSGEICKGWAFLEALYRAGRRLRIGFDDADWRSGRSALQKISNHHIFTLKMATAMSAET
jgi:hypothetical protein